VYSNPGPAKAPVTAVLRWLLLYPVAAAGCCFAVAAFEVSAAQVLAGILVIAVGAVAGWEASREGCDDRRCAGWAALAAVVTLVVCVTAAGAAYELIYCGNRDCRPVLD
jgi:hypothetical protein